MEQVRLLEIGEDSIRYDFFIALMESKNLNSWDIQLEYPINQKAFIDRLNAKSKRKEKPQLDLIVDKNGLKISVEFGLFRQNSNENGTINKTGRTVKMLNDMIRLALDSIETNRNSYFICVADDKMIGHQLRSKILGKFPSDYIINSKTISRQKEIKTSNFDERFVQVFEKHKLEINGKIVYNEEIKTDKISRETRVIIWEIKKAAANNSYSK